MAAPESDKDREQLLDALLKERFGDWSGRNTGAETEAA